jgi:hypothetical protein
MSRHDETPARRSRSSTFCVQQAFSTCRFSRRRMKECVSVGR